MNLESHEESEGRNMWPQALPLVPEEWTPQFRVENHVAASLRVPISRAVWAVDELDRRQLLERSPDRPSYVRRKT